MATRDPSHMKHVFRLRTVIIPLSMILVHLLVIDIVASLYAQSYPLISALFHWTDTTSGQGYATAQDLILNEYPRISVLYGLILIPLYSLILFFRRMNRRDAIWLKPPSCQDVIPALILSVGLLGVTNLLFSGLVLLGDYIPDVQRLMDEYLKQAQAFSPAIGYGWLVAGITMLAPLAEELLFRGIIQGELRRAFPEWTAVVFQAALVALFHVQRFRIIYVFLPALALGAMYAATRSLWIPILMHIAFNFLGSVIPAMIGNNEHLNQMVIWTEIGFAILSVGVISILVRRHKRA